MASDVVLTLDGEQCVDILVANVTSPTCLDGENFCGEIPMKKSKRRGNLSEFGDSLSTVK